MPSNDYGPLALLFRLTGGGGQARPEYPMHKPLPEHQSFRVDATPGMPAEEAKRIRDIGTRLYNSLLEADPDAREALLIASLLVRSVAMNVPVPLALGHDSKGESGYRGFHAGSSLTKSGYDRTLRAMAKQFVESCFAASKTQGAPDVLTAALVLWQVSEATNDKLAGALADDLAEARGALEARDDQGTALAKEVHPHHAEDGDSVSNAPERADETEEASGAAPIEDAPERSGQGS